MTKKTPLLSLGALGLMGAAVALSTGPTNAAVTAEQRSKSTVASRLAAFAQPAVTRVSTGDAVTQAPIDTDDVVDLSTVRRPLRQRGTLPAFVSERADVPGVCAGGPGRLFCATDTQFEAQEAVVGVAYNADGISLTALTGPTVDRLLVEYPDGRTQSVSPTDGLVSLALAQVPSRVTWSSAAGPQSLELARANPQLTK